MKIALLAPIEESVPPKKYGGTERVVYNLAEELVKLGHDVDLYATGDSITSANLIKVVEKPIRGLIAKNPRHWFDEIIKATYFINNEIKSKKYDIIHSHIDEPFNLSNVGLKSPSVTTLHNPLVERFGNNHSHQKFISISNAQRRVAPNLDYITTVYNGINIDKFIFNAVPKNYLIFLGRINSDKGIEQAIQIAKNTHQKLIIIAKVDPPDRIYFRNIIKPLINGKNIIYLGELDEVKKIEVLSNAKALLSPIQWDEPFGLVNIEALACGVPVLTINRGSMPEIFKKAKVGYLCNSEDELVEAVKKIDKISRNDCRKHVEKYFSSSLMAKNYLKAYKKILSN